MSIKTKIIEYAEISYQFGKDARAVCEKVIFLDFFNLQEWFDDISVDGEVSAWVDLVFVGCSRNPWAFAHKSMEWKKGAKQTDQAKEKGENPIDRRNLK